MLTLSMKEGQQEPLPLSKKLEVPLAMLTYSTCSISMIILNKLVIDTKGFGFPFVVVFFQNLSAVLVVLLLNATGTIEFPPLELRVVKRWLPLTGLFVGMLVTSLLALKTMSVPLQTLIKSLAIVVTAVGDYFLFGHMLNKTMLIAFAFMLSGSFIGATADSWVTMTGLFWSFANVACTSGYQLYMKGMLNDLKGSMGKWGPVYYNNVLSLPPLLIPVVVSYNEWSSTLSQLRDTSSMVYMTLMIFVSATLTMSSFWCMRVTSPTTYGVLGGMNKIPLTLLGVYIFNHYPKTSGWFGIAGSIFGGLLYSHAVNSGKSDNLTSISLSPSSIIGNTGFRPSFFDRLQLSPKAEQTVV